MNKTKRLLGAGIFFAAIWLIYQVAAESLADDVKPIPTETVKDSVRKAMQRKLVLSKEILNGLVLQDYDSIEKAAAEMKKVSLQSPQQIEGDRTENELYQHFRLEFLRINSLMEKMAQEKNLEGAAYAYQNLNANCLACHSYLHDKDE
ncbi:hypothetical protein [Thalassoglobus polymorphus]|uniref:Cytochrome C n=1 Tax=Thalassoglobus polymorphus TaxID=2527994 RepID=A0A517QGP2_9PLAN|nr:hypothetical protein [Thalassoglobus polymorphus]QDT30791.1 hypothetical protein Mal48_00180 [Thalassoglobus polymorphus]